MTQMMLIKWFMLLLAVPTEARLQDIWRPADSSVGEGMLRTIFETCYKHHESVNPIIIIGDFRGSIEGASIIRMDDALIVVRKYRPDAFSYNGPVTVFLIEHSLEKLQSDLEKVKETQWWDYRSVFFIIGKQKEAYSNFKNILITTWRMDIINTIYICPESMNTAELYTLNPITNYAPHPWERMKEFNDSNIYRQTFDPRISCKNLNYDKTEYLNGYPIYFEDTPVRKISKYMGAMTSALNASWEKLTGGFYPEDEISFGVIELGDTFLFPFHWDRIVIVVKTDEISSLQKIYHLWNPQVLHLAIISLIILLLVFAVKNNDIILGVLDIIRFLTYISIRTNTRSHPFRIYFTTMLILIVISNGVFQTNIASFLTKPDRTNPLKTMNELAESGYTFYYVLSAYDMVDMKWPINMHCRKCTSTRRVAGTNECIDFVLNGTRNACLVWSSTYERAYMKRPLELIEEQTSMTYFTIMTRRNWVLYDRAYYISMRLFESGLWEYWLQNDSYYRRHIRDADNLASKLEDIQPRYRPIKLSRLDFAFKMLAIGLSLAIFAFIFEWRDANI